MSPSDSQQPGLTKSGIRTDVSQAVRGWNRPDRQQRDNPTTYCKTFAWRKGWRDMSVECPSCGAVDRRTAALNYPGSLTCWECGAAWFQGDLVVSPAMVLNPEAEGGQNPLPGAMPHDR